MTTATETQVAQATPEELAPHAIEIEGLSIWHGRTPAVRNLSMYVPYGSIYGLIGPSGAGKTTTLRALATLQQPDAGMVLVDGIDVQADPAAARGRIGYLPDFFGVYERLTLREYLDFYGEIYGIPARRRAQIADELLELVALGDRRNSPVGCLSRGMKQRLGLARCLIHDPQILLLDEPASGMDPHSRLELRDMLQELRRLGKTILLCSHMLAELSGVCTHLGIMQEGALVAEGPASEIMNTLSLDAQLRVQLLDGRNRDLSRRLLEMHPACRQVEPEGESTLLVTVAGTQPDLAALLGHLCTNGVQVIEFALERRTLEDVFLQVTQMRAQA